MVLKSKVRWVLRKDLLGLSVLPSVNDVLGCVLLEEWVVDHDLRFGTKEKGRGGLWGRRRVDEERDRSSLASVITENEDVRSCFWCACLVLESLRNGGYQEERSSNAVGKVHGMIEVEGIRGCVERDVAEITDGRGVDRWHDLFPEERLVEMRKGLDDDRTRGSRKGFKRSQAVSRRSEKRRLENDVL